VLDQRISTGAPPTTSTGPSAGESTRAAPSVPAEPVTIASAREFDPQGDPPHEENPDEVRLAYDGNPATRWRTVRYRGSPKLGNIKRGVGLVLDLGQPLPVREVQLSLSGAGTNVQFRVPKSDPSETSKPPMSSDARWRSVAKQSKAGATATLTPVQPVTTRYVLVYLTSLPKEGRDYQGGIYEVEVRQ
jgi:putative peptidoglycan lipid II flippase